MWKLSFISEQQFINHVQATIEKYGEKLQSFDLKRFNKNMIDPIKLIFDKTVYGDRGKKSLAMKFLDREINPTIMILAIFIKEYFSI